MLRARGVGQGQWEGLGDQVTDWKSLDTDTSTSCGTAPNQGHIGDKAILYPGSHGVSHCGRPGSYLAIAGVTELSIPFLSLSPPPSGPFLVLSGKYRAFPLLEQYRGNLLEVTEQIH